MLLILIVPCLCTAEKIVCQLADAFACLGGNVDDVDFRVASAGIFFKLLTVEIAVRFYVHFVYNKQVAGLVH